MLDTLVAFDKDFFLFLNSFHSDFFDTLMWWISYKYTWIPFYIYLIYHTVKLHGRGALFIIIAGIVAVVLADFISVHGFKNNFERLRPCHQESINSMVHTVKDKCGGRYGFVSSHAANTFAAAMFFSLVYKTKGWRFILFLWAIIELQPDIFGRTFPC